ncbi:hypothetical protein D3C77_687130 [compost metagenome]
MTINWVAECVFLVRHFRVFVDDQLMAVEVEVDPLRCGAAFFQVKHFAVEFARCRDIVNWDRKVEWGQAHQKLRIIYS